MTYVVNLKERSQPALHTIPPPDCSSKETEAPDHIGQTIQQKTSSVTRESRPAPLNAAPLQSDLSAGSNGERTTAAVATSDETKPATATASKRLASDKTGN